jgi:hypothetical protein
MLLAAMISSTCLSDQIRHGLTDRHRAIRVLISRGILDVDAQRINKAKVTSTKH